MNVDAMMKRRSPVTKLTQFVYRPTSLSSQPSLAFLSRVDLALTWLEAF